MVQAAHPEEAHDVPRTQAARVPNPDDSGADAAQVAAETSFLRSVLIGVLIGMAACAVLWIGLVVIALAGTDEPLGPMVAVGAGVGLFAGVFFGGWAGSMVGARALEHQEKEEARVAARALPRT